MHRNQRFILGRLVQPCVHEAQKLDWIADKQQLKQTTTTSDDSSEM